MKNSLILILLLAVFTSCDTELRHIVVSEEALEFGTDSTFQVKYFVSRLPIFLLETDGHEIPDDPRITAKLSVIYNGEKRFNRHWDKPSDFEGLIDIERRGFTSQNFPKKQYALEILDDDTSSTNVELLGMPEENDWILYAPYSDKSLIRNVLMYNWWTKLGHYATRTKFCELVLNGEYHGVYVLMEQIKWDKNRVDIAKIGVGDNRGDSLTGGYIIKIDKPVGGDGEFDWKTQVEAFDSVKANVSFQYDYPKDNDITQEQETYIQNYVNEFEQTLLNDDFANKKQGYRKFIDTRSFIDFFLMQELAHNVDAYRSSTYLHKKRDSKGGKLYAGPIWDFNLALGNTDGCDGEKAEGWALDHPCDPSVIPFWWKRMAQDSTYSAELSKRWWELRQGILSNQNLLADIDRTVLQLGGSVERNYRRWPILGVKIWPNYFVGNTYQEEIHFLKKWLVKRVEWMDKNIAKPE